MQKILNQKFDEASHAEYTQPHVNKISPATVWVFLFAIDYIFDCDCRYIWLRLQDFLPAKASNFACQSRVNLHECRM